MTYEKNFNNNQKLVNQKVNVEFDSMHDFDALNMRQRSDLRRNLTKDKNNKSE